MAKHKELIERLAREANFEPQRNTNVRQRVAQIYLASEADVERFAALIVAECVKVVEHHQFSSPGAAFDGMALIHALSTKFATNLLPRGDTDAPHK
jgi:hypothetical protein